MSPLRALLGDEVYVYAKKITVLTAAATPLILLGSWIHGVTVMRPIRDAIAGEIQARQEAVAHVDTTVAVLNKRLEQLKVGQDALIEIGSEGVYSKSEIDRIVGRANSRIEALESEIDIIEARMARARIR